MPTAFEWDNFQAAKFPSEQSQIPCISTLFRPNYYHQDSGDTAVIVVHMRISASFLSISSLLAVAGYAPEGSLAHDDSENDAGDERRIERPANVALAGSGAVIDGDWKK